MGTSLSLQTIFTKTFEALCQYRTAGLQKQKAIQQITETLFCTLHQPLYEGKYLTYAGQVKKPELVEISCMNTTTDYQKVDTRLLKPFFSNVWSDVGWMPAFATKPQVPYRYGLDIYTVSKKTGQPFQKVPEGFRSRFVRRTSQELGFDADKFSEGMSFTWEMRKKRQIAKFITEIGDTVYRMGARYAYEHYKVLLDAGVANVGNKISFNATATTEAQKTILTLNAAVEYLRDANKEEGIGNPDTTQFLLYGYRKGGFHRISSALRMSPEALAMGGEAEPEYADENIRYIPTYEPGFKALWDASKTCLLVWPGGKIQNSFIIPEQGESFTWQTPDDLGMKILMWISFVAGCGLNTQVVQVELE
jgi:hypothetical protein